MLSLSCTWGVIGDSQYIIAGLFGHFLGLEIRVEPLPAAIYKYSRL